MSVYGTLRWRVTRSRAIARDAGRCTVSRLLGGTCSAGALHAHHIVPVSRGGDPYDLDNVGTTCASHHPQWEALRRSLVDRQVQEPEAPRCRHQHASREAREICQRRMARQYGRGVAA